VGVCLFYFANDAIGADIFSCEKPGTIAITYDDGPYLYTNEVLDIFNEFGAKATFFVTYVRISSILLRRISLISII
jgi:peptidoglycan/xylan/chitin deacetylase (PgdA/CDA1 family)